MGGLDLGDGAFKTAILLYEKHLVSLSFGSVQEGIGALLINGIHLGWALPGFILRAGPACWLAPH